MGLSTLAQALDPPLDPPPLDRAAALGMIAILDMTTKGGHDHQGRCDGDW
jgi:hypothetical protein